ncbi:MAG: hypothetical protein R6W86_00130 [Marinobacter sp.]|uniref:hypothetical protein n=1 Tax=Marinobacter sp. TaxID=50741 RepID=UPI00396D89AB
MDVIRVLRKGSLVLGASVMAGCGGGGGDGDTAVALTCESDALPAYELTLDLEHYADQQVTIATADDVTNMLGIYNDVEVGFALIDNVRTALKNQSGDQPACVNEADGGTATLSVSGSGNNIEERWQFTDCVVSTSDFGQVLLTGTYQNGEGITDQTSKWQRGEEFEIYDQLQGEIVDPEAGTPFTINGRSSVVFEVELASGDGCVKENVSGLEFELGGKYVALPGSETLLKKTGSTTEISIEGTLVGSSVGGYLEVSTPDPIVFVETQNCPREGTISVSSDGEARVLYGDSANGTASATGVAVWINGDSTSFPSCQDIGVEPLSND